jgi:hypothetical protein
VSKSAPVSSPLFVRSSPWEDKRRRRKQGSRIEVITEANYMRGTLGRSLYACWEYQTMFRPVENKGWTINRKVCKSLFAWLSQILRLHLETSFCWYMIRISHKIPEITTPWWIFKLTKGIRPPRILVVYE